MLAELAESGPGDLVITAENKSSVWKHSYLLARTFPPQYPDINGILRKQFCERMIDDCRPCPDLNC